MILVFCQNQTDPNNLVETFVTVSFMTVEPSAITPISMSQVTSIDQCQIDDMYIFVNDLEAKKGEGIIYVFELDVKDTDLYTYNVLDKNFFRVEGDFEIESFEILPTETGNQDKLFVAERYMRFYAFNYNSTLNEMKQGLKDEHIIWSANLKDELQDNQLYYTNSTELQKTFTYLYEESEDGYNIYTSAVHLSDTGIYYITFSFDEKNATDARIYIEFLGVFNNYGTYQSQITLKGNDNSGLFAEIYKNPNKNEILLGLYDIADMPNPDTQKLNSD